MSTPIGCLVPNGQPRKPTSNSIGSESDICACTISDRRGHGFEGEQRERLTGGGGRRGEGDML